MGEEKEFKRIENVGSEGPDKGNGKLPKLKVKHEAANLEFQLALDYLQQVLETAKGGNFHVETDGKSVDLSPADAVDLEIKAKDKGGRQSLSFELTWDREARPEGQAAETLEENIQGDVCVAHRVHGMEAEAGDYDDLERRFELELFGSCGCVEIPGS